MKKQMKKKKTSQARACERTTTAGEVVMKCCICGKVLDDELGNNPAPVVKDEKAGCCDHCNLTVVVPARLACE